MDLRPATLVGRHARLEPFTAAHGEPLRVAAAADPDIWEIYPVSLRGDHFDAFWARVTDDQQRGVWLPFAVVVDERVAGMTSFIQPDPANAAVEIGGTYYRPDVRGGPVNPQSKRLMLAHAFEAGARRVAFRVDAVNARSRAAVRKLGAVEEGVLRQDRVTWTGRVRDTAISSILAAEWPAVRAGLDARLAAFG